MSNRKRMTWAAGREASAPPATPGYGTADQDHPAHQNDPAYEAYKKGDPSAWAEDPHPAPYPEGNPPSTPGYDSADQDHPAHQKAPRVPKEANMRDWVMKRSAKCVRIARNMLGRTATEAAIEDQALDIMAWDDSTIDSTLERMGGGFLADDEMDDGFDEALGFDEEEMEVEEAGRRSMDDILAEIEGLKAEIYASRGANQNDPSGSTLAPGARSEEQVRSEAAGLSSGEAKGASPFTAMFDAYDTDGDGFVTTDDWRGDRAVFAALDSDKDGIIARDEVIKAFGGQMALNPHQGELYDGLDDDESEMLDEMLAEIDGNPVGCGDVMASKRKAKKSDDEEDDSEEADDEDETEASKKARGRKAKKSDDEEDDSEEADDEDEEASKKARLKALRAARKAKKSDDEEDDSEDEEASKKARRKAKKSDDDDEESDDEEASKKAKKSDDDEDGEGDDEEAGKSASDEAAMFAIGGDPMGLAGDTDLGDDDAMLAEIFGGDLPKAAKKSEDEEADDEDADDSEEADDDDSEEASKKATKQASGQKPRRRKAAAGPRTLGQVTKAASVGRSEVDELSKLWETAPDVSDVFGT